MWDVPIRLSMYLRAGSTKKRVALRRVLHEKYGPYPGFITEKQQGTSILPSDLHSKAWSEAVNAQLIRYIVISNLI